MIRLQSKVIIIIIIKPRKTPSLIIILIERYNRIWSLFQDGAIFNDWFTSLLDETIYMHQYESLALESWVMYWLKSSDGRSSRAAILPHTVASSL